MNKCINSCLILIFLATASCGTIMYPERKGQSAGQIDPQIAILNGVGTLLFFIPGVIAFAVDFNNGAIYLPTKGNKVKKIINNFSSDNEDFNKRYIEKLLANELGMNPRYVMSFVNIKKIDRIQDEKLYRL